jgi:hypothetical protein
MQRRNQLLGAGCAVFLAVSTLDLATAGTPPKEGPALITMSEANGFVAVAERTTAAGAVVGTFRSNTATVTMIGRRGSSISFHPSLPTAERPGTLRISMATARPKTAKDATAYRDSGRSVIDDLVALGMPRDEAEREFGDLATIGSTAPVSSRVPVTIAGSHPGASASALPAAADPPTPYDTQCASINVGGGKITGYGCATFFLVRRQGTDWWLTTKMKVSAHSSDGSWFSPKRLTQLGWRVSWSARNTLHDWDPYNTHPVGSCVTLTVKSSSPFADVSVQGNICPDSLGPWAVTTARSGGIWNGMERGTDWEGALATQAVHSPPGAAVSYQSAWTLSYCDLWCN